MKTYKVKIRLIAPYLQARYSEEEKAKVAKPSGERPKINDTGDWLKFCYKDEKGFYIPAEQLEGSLENGGKRVKRKPAGTYCNFVKSYFFIDPRRVYIDKDKPDEIITSYPVNKIQKNRVKITHPQFSVGLEAEFNLVVQTDEIMLSTVAEIFERAGKENGIGARRPRYGRYEVVELEEIS